MGEITFQVPEGKVSDCGRYTEYAFERAEDFYKYLKLFKILHKDGQWIFRGQWDHTWDLKPNALRNNRYTTIDEFVKNAREEGNRYSCIFRVWREILDIVNFMDVSNKFGLECGFTSEIYKYKSELDRVSNNVSNQHGYLWKIIEDEAVDVFLHPDLTHRRFFNAEKYEKLQEKLIYLTNKAQSHLSEDDEMLILEWPNVRKYPEISNVLALAQHHGLPTRLLDFSYDPLVAIYFAVSNWFESRAEYHKNIEIWAYDLFHMDIGDDFNKRFKKISPKINRMDNIFAQSGVLMLDTKCNYIYNKEGRWPNFTDLSSGLKRITLPQINAREILGFLRRDSINPAMIQPNLYSTAKTVLYNMV